MCSGAPQNLKTEEKCPLADYIFDPVLGDCRRGDGDSTCPSKLPLLYFPIYDKAISSLPCHITNLRIFSLSKEN